MNLDIEVNGKRIEAVLHGPGPERAPTLVLLHEGLGCVSMWRDFPEKLAQRTGYGVLVYSRPGYGKSDPVNLPRPLDYMHREAFDVLPHVLDQAGVEKTILVGHSDGASIATIYAGGRQDFRVRGLVLLAPHFFVEDISIKSIAEAKVAYETGDLRARLARHHGENVDIAFHGWNDAWLDSGFRNWRIDDALAHVRVPMLIVQGKDDQYGTLAQLRLAEADAYCPVETAILGQCGHSPQIDRPDPTLGAISEFVHRVLALHEGLKPAA
jgi:pimeloyl-ACP methyl ester carboxylesterase